MAVIDFDGKLFGKINVIDLLIILILVFGLIFVGRVIYNLAKPNETWVIVDFRFDKIENEVANSVEAGYVEKVEDKIVAEVLDVKYLPPSSNIIAKPVLLKVKLLVKLENNQLIHESRNLFVGTYRSLTFGPKDSDYGYVYFNNGFVMNIDKELEKNETEKIVEIKFYGQYPWIKDAIKVGSKESNYQNETIAEVISKEVKFDEFVHVIENSGEVLVIKNPIKDEITLRLKLHGKVGEDGVFIFKYDRVLVGNKLTLDLDKSLSLNGVVTKIE